MRPWTPKSAVNRSKRRIQRAVEELTAVALEWGDVDQSIVDNAEAFIGQLDEFSEFIEKSIQERIAAGEHVGI